MIDRPTARPGTPEDLAVCQDYACRMIDVLNGLPVDQMFGALSLLTSSFFIQGIEKEFQLQAFDDYAATVRRAIQESMT